MSEDFFITGVSFGIGREIAKRLTQNGGRVFGIARTETALEELQRQIGKDRFCYAQFDVSDLTASADQILAQMEKEKFFPATVILNAAVNPADLGFHYDFQIFKNVIDTNLYGVFRWIALFLPRFEREKRGHFVAISSLAAYVASPRSAGYAAGKAALSRAFDSFRVRYRREGVHFTAIHLGPVETRMWTRKEVPWILSVDEAVDCVMRALKEKKGVYHRPFMLATIMRLLSIAPREIVDWLVERVDRKINLRNTEMPQRHGDTEKKH